ncbi:Ger(x)C family spore germination C-terminal domain-containing protein [Iocasia frigidifontis]|uniref:Ger(x)C family spore germination C-terminal domain-containing protein n=1 Tax=Iocasia fonsfrigidae TaxID=2682810 RepID=UPI0022A92EC9|nr:Ger(x)C family spore germination C-terminal domain-containing protein [Iocasia fonsfrigidae]
MDSSIYNVPSPGKSDDLIVIEVFNARTAIIPELKKDNIRFKIEINSEGTLVEQQGDIDTSKPAVITIIEKNLEKIIKKEVENTIDIVQKKYQSDVFGFGSLFNQKYPQDWQKIKEDWNEIFPQVECSVKVKTEIRRTGLLLEAMDISK